MRANNGIAIVIAAFVAAVGCKRKTETKTDEAVLDETTTNLDRATQRLDLSGDELPAQAIARLGSRRMLDRSLQRLVFTPDGKHIVSNSDEAYVVWSAETGKLERTLEARDANYPIAMAPSGSVLATGVIGKGAIEVWDFAKGEVAKTLEGHLKEVSALCFLGDDTIVSGSEDGSVRVWAIEEGEETRKLTGTWKQVTAIDCAAKGKLFAWGTEDGGVYRHDAAGSAEKVLNLGKAEKRINAVSISADSAFIAAGSADDAVRVWKAAEPGEPVEVAAHKNAVTSVQFSPDSTRVYSSGGDQSFRAWDPKSGELLADLPGVEKLASQYMALSPRGITIASWSEYSGGRGTEGGRFWLWDANDGASLAEPERHSESVGAIAYSPDGNLLATGSDDGSIRLWEATTGKPIEQLGDLGGRVRSVQFSADGKSVLASGEFAKLVVWDRKTGSQQVKTEPIGGEVVSFDISRDGKRMVSGDEIGRVWTIDLSTGLKLKSHDREAYSAITSVAFTNDDKHIAIAGRDKAILVVDAETSADIVRLRPGDVVSNFALAFSPDGKTMASGGDDHSIRLWSTSPWKELSKLAGHDGTVRAVAFSADGKRLVSGSNDETVRVWDVANGESIATFEGHVGAVTAVDFAPDGKSVASVAQDQTGLVWQLP